jgi:hypothetical protein
MHLAEKTTVNKKKEKKKGRLLRELVYEENRLTP